MRPLALSILLSVCARPIAGQQIWDIWQTTWDRSKLFASTPANPPITFGTPSSIGQADIVVNDDQVLQNIFGFGSSLTDNSAMLMNNLKQQNSGNYWNLLNYLFNPTDGANAAGLTYIRVPLGASDFSSSVYSFDDTANDNSLNNFNVNRAPSYLFTVLKDIQSVNPLIKVHVVPWSPPGWMKNSGTMKGGSLNSNQVQTYAQYLLKCLQGFRNNGIPLYAISVQNEPQNNNPTYPTSTYSPQLEAQVGSALRSLMNSNGLGSVKLIGYDHNWGNAGTYPVQLMDAAPNAFAGVAFHCYEGSVSQQDQFRNRYPNKEVYFTECSGTLGSDWWSDIKWYMDNIFIGSVEHGSSTGLMWNIALDGNGNPKLPGTNSCGGPGCRGVVQINNDGTWNVNQEFYAMAQLSKATIPKDAGGPFGQRIGVSIGGELNWALRVAGFVTRRTNSADWSRYSLVVLNWNDQGGGSWNPQPVQTTIEFRGLQARITFPVGITTLWWFAPNNNQFEATNTTVGNSIPINTDTQVQEPLAFFSKTKYSFKQFGHQLAQRFK
ncbi:glycoside hydrolase family 30 protein [Moniliophthora roreri MCA 2997]|uniref:Glycoside hydrolase family 30 protein n=1 Tax=Moniliophthora roreri (strain MCA 2997) TaxID=1381753 RepID=V2XSK7_MONRO|nr:glycoside hydrolase family 30 protein [Moniliophthora roreri MCA 2997]